jgi:hypothetical protein
MISERALRRLVRQWWITRALQALSFFVGLIFVLIAIQKMLAHFIHGDAESFSVIMIMPMGLSMLTIAPLFGEFALSLQVAAALTSDAVLEVVNAVNAVSPNETEVWEARVVTPALALANGAVGLLSKGWGRGLALAYVGWWGMAVGFFGMFVRTMMSLIGAVRSWSVIQNVGTLSFVLIALGLPLLMSRAVAAVSTSCDEMGNAINQRRIEDLDRSPRLLALELALENLNERQGLGFVVLDSVLDKKKLRTICEHDHRQDRYSHQTRPMDGYEL